VRSNRQMGGCPKALERTTGALGDGAVVGATVSGLQVRERRCGGLQGTGQMGWALLGCLRGAQSDGLRDGNAVVGAVQWRCGVKLETLGCHRH
jgi:hypothetical protein